MADLFPMLYWSIVFSSYEYYLAHVAGREPHTLHALARVSWIGSICTIMQILHALSQREVRK